MVKSPENLIKVEIRCKKCGKLLFILHKKGIDKRNNYDIIVSRCNRCGKDNHIKI